MDLQHIFNILVGIIMALLSAILGALHKKTEKTQEDVSDFKTHVAENYAHNGRLEDIKKIVANTNQRVDDIYRFLTKGHP